ncbi:MAG: molybdopterin-dependent oxidoreductase [Deltaproteobacteria bacterium]|nr:molybdopterin-dependent oxidoreductase [Deltaproteobacteria bacterium]
MTQWKPTACILCECNCGLQVQLGGDDGRHLVRLRGDKAHPMSRGYACEKAHRLDYYQNNRDRLTSPMRRRPDGTFEAIDWDTAIGEIAQRLAAVRDEHGGESIFYYGGGGQGNHLPGAYASATRRALGSRYRSNALAQEKTGEMWVTAKMLGVYTRGDFEHCEVAMFIGKNPWHSHSIPRARVTLKAIAKDPARTMIVIDPRRSETAAMADIHLAVRPGGDAWLLAAMVAVLVQDDRLDHEFLTAHAEGVDAIVERFGSISIADYCQRAGVDEADVRRTVDVIARAGSVASFEDLGVQMNHNSTLVSYLHRLVWLLTGNLGKPGTHYVPTSLVNLGGGSGGNKQRTSPVVGARIIGGLVPCNVIAEEILADHPARYRAMIVEAANPAHSLADSQRFREAMGALDTLVVIDVAMTETAQLADYVLPTSTQYEKAEATFFNFEFPENGFHLRQPILTPPPGVLSEAEIHARLVEALGAVTEDDIAPLREAATRGAPAFAQVFFTRVMPNPRLAGLAPVLLFRALAPTLPEGLAEGAVLWGAAMRYAMQHGPSMARAGFDGPAPVAAAALFQAILERPSGVVFAVDEWNSCLERVRGKRAQLVIPELLQELDVLDQPPPAEAKDYPFVLSAGERRSLTANTIVRNPDWRNKKLQEALRMSPHDAQDLGIETGDRVRLSTKRGSAVVVVDVSEMMRPGHVSLPNGLGLGYPDAQGARSVTGVPANELTAAEDRDPFAGTPWHKHVPARIEALASA